MDQESGYGANSHAKIIKTKTVVQSIQLIYARLVIPEPDELDGDMFLGATFGTHVLDYILDESFDVSGLPVGVGQDIVAYWPLRFRRRLASKKLLRGGDQSTKFIYMLLRNIL